MKNFRYAGERSLVWTFAGMLPLIVYCITQWPGPGRVCIILTCGLFASFLGFIEGYSYPKDKD